MTINIFIVDVLASLLCPSSPTHDFLFEIFWALDGAATLHYSLSIDYRPFSFVIGSTIIGWINEIE